MKGIAVAVMTACIVAGCATTYQSVGFSGGFTEMQMAQDVYRIKFSGNAFTGSDEATQMAMLRAAELTIQSGYTHFVVMDANDSTKSTAYYDPGVTTTTLRPTGMGAYSATTNTTGAYATNIDKPRSEIVIRMHQAGQGNGMAAQTVYDRYAPLYKPTAR